MSLPYVSLSVELNYHLHWCLLNSLHHQKPLPHFLFQCIQWLFSLVLDAPFSHDAVKSSIFCSCFCSAYIVSEFIENVSFFIDRSTPFQWDRGLLCLPWVFLFPSFCDTSVSSTLLTCWLVLLPGLDLLLPAPECSWSLDSSPRSSVHTTPIT